MLDIREVCMRPPNSATHFNDALSVHSSSLVTESLRRERKAFLCHWNRSVHIALTSYLLKCRPPGSYRLLVGGFEVEHVAH